MADSSVFRCYYEDGTITTSDFCSDPSSDNSPLLKSELDIIADVESTPPTFPWLLIILAMIALASKKSK